MGKQKSLDPLNNCPARANFGLGFDLSHPWAGVRVAAAKGAGPKGQQPKGHSQRGRAKGASDQRGMAKGAQPKGLPLALKLEAI